MDHSNYFLHSTVTMSSLNNNKAEVDFYGENETQGKEGDKPIPFLR
jgi:hypothetical protein